MGNHKNIELHEFVIFLGFSDELEDVECGETGCETHGPENRACLPIHVPFNDTDFGFNQKDGGCLMFVRSLPVPFSSSCRLGWSRIQ